MIYKWENHPFQEYHNQIHITKYTIKQSSTKNKTIDLGINENFTQFWKTHHLQIRFLGKPGFSTSALVQSKVLMYKCQINLLNYIFIHTVNIRIWQINKKYIYICMYIYILGLLVEMPLSQKCVKIVNSWGPTTQLDICVIYLALASKPQEINRGKIIVAVP